MVRAAHPSFTRMVRSPSSDMFERVVRAPMHLRMVPPVTAAFRQEPLETGSLNHCDRVRRYRLLGSHDWLPFAQAGSGLCWLLVFHALEYTLLVASQ